jgi:hypothetical protein
MERSHTKGLNPTIYRMLDEDERFVPDIDEGDEEEGPDEEDRFGGPEPEEIL